ncbi:non-ribosomal peptide synthetase [Iningainema tapete]|uniref:Amino acid adenylation domain-containing protein n=1 Tax=Iningainema tapete BLCC-T55 TaxID=2748662 RepID=A0A8J7C7L7_9CYAN|nr:non-ribosomal peptide synthetase [Iningainema tapete]MBD2775784.1 amino acid adenylation domain-containing protein [Iningainema tapete BLCC-T55]
MDEKRYEISQLKSKLSPTKQALLEKRLRGKTETNSQLKVIPRRSHDPAPLSSTQARLWFLHQLDPKSPVYNELTCIRLLGTLNVVVLEQSLNEIVQRHESLRTNIEMVEGQPVQVIHPNVTVTLSVVHLHSLPEAVRQIEVERLTTELAHKPFDLTSDRLLRVTLLQTLEQEHLLVFVIHHIAADGWSMQVLLKELTILYKAFDTVQPSPLPALPIQYADFAIWQHQWLQQRQQTQISYWKQQLADVPTVLLPNDRPRPPVQSFQGAVIPWKLSLSLTHRLRAMSNREGVTLFMTLLAAFQTLLYRYTQEDDICVGSPIANRNQTEIQGLIGFFVNTLVLRTNLSGNPSFLELLRRVREVCVGAYAHADLPFEQLVQELHPERNLSYMPFFQVMFVLLEDIHKELTLPGLTLSWHQMHSKTAKFDLTLYVIDGELELTGFLEYNTDLFNSETITRMVEHFQTLLESITANPQAKLSDLPLLTATELHTLIVEWNNTSTDWSSDVCIHELFEAQAAMTPDAIAVVFEEQKLTYRELNTRANQLAHYLRKLGVKPEVLVGICIERSPEMAIALLGILKAGGAYVPLDPAYPQQRLAFMLEDAKVSVLLTTQQANTLGQHQAQIVYLDTDWDCIALESPHNPVNHCTTDNLAYVIYTSGSTGKPKGVCGLHRGAVNRFQWMWQKYPFTPDEVCCQKTSLNFVDSVWEIFGPLLQGIPTVIVPDSVVLDPPKFVATLAHHNVTRLVLVPSLLRVLLENEDDLQLRLPKLKLWVTSGEAISIDLLQNFRLVMPNSTLLNLYGSSEVSADVTYKSIEPLASVQSRVAIGRPIANTQVYVLDKQQKPLPTGIPGELYVGGAGLARGYLNRPDLTNERFIPNPFTDFGFSGRLYKTGDRSRYLPNGDLEYLGRIDYQVKVRGFRIELGEIEAVLAQHPVVKQAVVIASPDEPSKQQLVAYVVSHPQQTVTVSELHHLLKQQLPEYMIPRAFVTLEALPLLPNGKIDRHALRVPDQTRPELQAIYQQPQTEIEKTIAQIWQEVLHFEGVGIHDNFFELGGHSLLLLQVHNKLRQIFPADLSILELFRYPTISSLAELLAKTNNNKLSSTQIDSRTEKLQDGKARIKKILAISNKFIQGKCI